MTTLNTQLRNKLERTVVEARKVSEIGAKEALESLAVHHYEPYEQMSSEQRQLRNHLRARARQLGDRQDKSGRLDMRHIVHECAYEYWHRMLFARFLAENDLLIDPEMGVSITLAECEELARDVGEDKWVYASHCAQDMLPQIFRPSDPLLQVPFATNHRVKLEALLDGLTRDTFTATDAVGWVYQFWQSKKKDEVNASGNKIGADELPPVTQLFTEDYMVDFLLDNTLGAWWAVAGASSSGITSATEAECRKACALPGCEWKYLRFIKVAGASSSGEDEHRHRQPKPKQPEQDAPATIAPDWETLKIQQGDNLPHWTCDHAIYHVCFRLADSIPQAKLAEWKDERDDIMAAAKQAGRELSEAEEKRLRYLYSEKIEKYLDAGHGECWLKKPQIAKLVADALRHFDGQRYRLHAWSIMPNHVHVIVEPIGGHELGKIAHSWKSFTSNKANEILGQTGQFWQHEPYDHIIRSEKEYCFQLRYVWENPDEAGLKDWPWRKVARASCFGESGRSFQLRNTEEPEQEPELEAPATTWKPASGSYEGWPKTTAELKCLDPCCGSGHFLVAMLERLVPMRMAEEGLSKPGAVRAVLRDNIHGLEIDPRCTQLAAFALALAAWKMIVAGASSSGKAPEQDAPATFDLPQLNIACSGLEIGGTKEEWCALAPGNNFIMNQVYDLFRNASTLGSLIDPASQVKTGVGGTDIGSLKETIVQGLEKFRNDQDFERQEMGVAGGGVLDAYEVLTGGYTLVATNVPYLARGKQSDTLKNFCEQHHPAAKNDLATVFLERCLGFCEEDGGVSVVIPQNWLFLTSYRKLREQLLHTETWRVIARLGEGGFESSAAAGAFTVLLALSRGTPKTPNQQIAGLDVAAPRTAAEKAARLLTEEIKRVAQEKQLENPDARVALEYLDETDRLESYAYSHEGLTTGDLNRFVRKFWEWEGSCGWSYYIQNVIKSKFYGGRTDIIHWGSNGELVADFPGAYIKGRKAWGRAGLRVTQMRHLPVTMYAGSIFGKNAATVIPHNAAHLPAIWCYCSSPEYNEAVRRIDQKLNVTNATLVKVPFDLERWQKVAAEKYPNGLPKPYSNDPTQWIFHGHPCGSVVWNEESKRLEAASNLRADATVLHIAVARLLGYRWPAELDATMELAPEQRAWVERCEELLPYSDADGIVCIPSVRGEEAAVDRLLAILRKSYGDEWNENKVRELIAATESKAESLDDWLRNDFFEQHCKLFHHRPFIWHIWDGRKRDGFHALVNYHKLCGGRSFQLRQGEPEQDAPASLGRKLLEKLTHSYLGDWITRQKDGVNRGEGGADDRLAAATELQKRLLAILEGEPPFDIFVRWKPLHQQPIGWTPDINDGVRLNIRPFMASDLPKDVCSGARKGAGILRYKPNINWKKDRGKEPQRPKEEYPWFWSWDEAFQDFMGGTEFDGNRWNDLHYTNAVKEAARERLAADHVEKQRK